MTNKILKKPLARAIQALIGTKVAIVTLTILGMSSFSTHAALIKVTNVNSGTNGGYAFVDSGDSFLADPPGKIFFGGFSSTYTTAAAIQTAFYNDFSALTSDFISIGNVGVESDTLGGVQGLHDSSSSGLDSTAVVGRFFAIWLTVSGTINDTNTEHLIYLTSETFASDPASPAPENGYTATIRPGVNGNGTLAVGGVGAFTRDYGTVGDEATFNTVAIPEPSSFLILAGLGFVGLIVQRRRRLYQN
tara:strand:+ start:1473 stop:2213 length:741 start_codon:yes stop_codon:yes gene_type:complete